MNNSDHISARDCDDSGQLVLPARNCVTGEYRYGPVLGCRFLYTANSCGRFQIRIGQRQHKRRLCVLILEPD